MIYCTENHDFSHMQYLPSYSPVYDQELSENVSYSFVIIIIAVHLSERLNNY